MCVPHVGLVVPAPVVEILVVVGNLAAADPVNRHALVVVSIGGVVDGPCVDVPDAYHR